MATFITLKDAAEKYVEPLEAIGKKPSTLGTTRRTMDLVESHMGEDKIVEKILTVHVAGFFKSEAATMQPGKDGPKARAEASILQIRRIMRSALVWWHEQGFFTGDVPLPNSEKRYLEPRESKKAKDQKAKDTKNAPATDETAVDTQ